MGRHRDRYAGWCSSRSNDSQFSNRRTEALQLQPCSSVNGKPNAIDPKVTHQNPAPVMNGIGTNASIKSIPPAEAAPSRAEPAAP